MEEESGEKKELEGAIVLLAVTFFGRTDGRKGTRLPRKDFVSIHDG